jgi:RimJ/RimL family protein N-acetyltransferase
MKHLQLQGEIVRLEALNSDTDNEVMARWSEIPGSWRLLDALHGWHRPAPDSEQPVDSVGFRIHALDESDPIGHAGLFGICWPHHEAWLGIELDDRAYWDGHYGPDALRLMLRYGFDELGLRRVAIGVFDYDARIMRALEEAGFIIEGRMLDESGHGAHGRAGLVMGIRREAWSVMSNQ